MPWSPLVKKSQPPLRIPGESRKAKMLWNTSLRSKAKPATADISRKGIAGVQTYYRYEATSDTFWASGLLPEHTRKNQSGILAGSKSSRGDHNGGQRWSTNQSKPVASNLVRGRRYCGSRISKREEDEWSDNSLAEQDHHGVDTETVTKHEQPKAGESQTLILPEPGPSS